MDMIVVLTPDIIALVQHNGPRGSQDQRRPVRRFAVSSSALVIVLVGIVVLIGLLALLAFFVARRGRGDQDAGEHQPMDPSVIECFPTGEQPPARPQADPHPEPGEGTASQESAGTSSMEAAATADQPDRPVGDGTDRGSDDRQA